MKKATIRKPYWETNAEELAEATKAYDKPLPPGSTRPLTKAERAQFERMRRTPHRSVYVPRGGDGTTLVRLDPEVMGRAMKYAAARKLSLSEVINRSLKGLLAMVE